MGRRRRAGHFIQRKGGTGQGVGGYQKTCDQDETIEGEILNRVKGGFTVDIGVQAFLPGSQADLRPIRNLDEMVGKDLILKY